MVFNLFKSFVVIAISVPSFTWANDNLPDTVFWDNEWPSDTDGELKGTVLFAQAQILPSKHRIEGDYTQPHLTAIRKTLVMFQPSEGLVEDTVPLQMTAKDKDGMILGSVNMENPNNIPKQDGWIPVSSDIYFPPSLESPYIIEGNANLQSVNDPNAVYLTNKLNTVNNKVRVKYRDGAWSSDLYLPNGNSVPIGSKVWVTSNAGYAVRVNYPNTVTGGWRTRRLTRNTELMLVLSDGVWLAEEDFKHNDYVFGKRFWTVELNAEWVYPGLMIEFQQGNKVGSLNDIDIGGFAELVMTVIDAGFLTEPRNEFAFKDDETTHREYYETLPVSRFVVAEYETLHLTEVMLPSGKLYTEQSDDDGGWHSGDMRQYTGKILLSHGIDLANYGISSSSGSSESAHPFTCALLTAHNTVGMYQNGRQVHGGSGGNGIVTLDSSIGNEMSHEAGHNYGLGHYVGGFEGSVHRSAENIGSTWGWDSDVNVFIPNFASDESGEDRCCCPNNNNDQCQSPFLGKYQFSKDSMAGGG